MDIGGMILVYHRYMMVVLQLQLQHQIKITRFHLVKVTYAKNFVFVRDGIHSVADYNSTLMGVVVIVVVVVALFHNGIT